MGVVSKAGDEEEGREDANEAKATAVRTSKYNLGYIAAVPTAASGPASLPKSCYPLILAKVPISPPHLPS